MKGKTQDAFLVAAICIFISMFFKDRIYGIVATIIGLICYLGKLYS